MEYYMNLQKAIDYIEDHLETHVELDQIAKCAGYSIPHFYRVFGAIVGCTVKDYVRRRKLSEAVMDLVSTSQGITEIAFKYGYESNEVFTRAFHSVYGMSPSKFRKSKMEPSILSKVNLITENRKIMRPIIEAEIVYKDERWLLGIARKINQGDNMKYGLLTNVKNEFMEIEKGFNAGIKSEIYYAAYEYNSIDIFKEEDAIHYMYYYGIEVSEFENLPCKDLSLIKLPQSKYAVFSYDIDQNTLNGVKLNQPVYDYIDGVWLPNSGYVLSDAVDYEVIDVFNKRTDYYISIK